ncbi:hypothetical protein [Microbacterium telephonicum]|uniref:Uncharacterized protein n=1 Tax=Microbacterium telephonicum TaxID=1714841 RepID=A0A498C5D1_9MICO|nr:hypothetical protein [Microbacterium telephonicum]RLK47661.1 hypothetical protein C7474_2257 [Microbacterium telephonicum]
MTNVESTRRRPADNGVRAPEELIGKAAEFRKALAEIDQEQNLNDGSLVSLWLNTADALERAIKDLDARFAESDHQSAKYYRRMRDAEREMHARELHHFEEEQRRVEAETERNRLAAVIGEITDLLPHGSFEPACEADIGYYDAMQAVRRILTKDATP